MRLDASQTSYWRWPQRSRYVCVFKLWQKQSIIHFFFKSVLWGHSISTLSVSPQTSRQLRSISKQLLCLVPPANEDLWLMVSNQIDDLHSGAATVAANCRTGGRKEMKGRERIIKRFRGFPSGVMHRLHGRTLRIVPLFNNWGR